MEMTNQEARSLLSVPEKMKLKQVGKGVFVKRVVGKRLLVKTIEPWTEADQAEQTSGLYIPPSIKEKNTPLPTFGVIVQLGTTVAPDEFEEGELVLFGKFAGMDFTMQQDKYRLIHVDEVVAVLDVDMSTIIAPVKEE